MSLVVSNLVGGGAGVYQQAPESSVTEDFMPPDAEARVLFLQEQLRRQRALASLRERMLAALPFYNSDNPRVQELVALEGAEWALREKVLKQQRKNRLQLFINRHEQLLRMMAIASIVGIAGGLTIKKVWDKNDKNSKAYQDTSVTQAPKKKAWERLTTELPVNAQVSISA